ncbi:MAG: CBS domain-containing protein [Pirellulaceae bacterium]|jgi:CBS domain-containing protein/Flp pilus assembly pilin Flp|nr:CBS domain-containing protein [Pirellulaceae bacterium]MDP7015457.1 CBS domain-containing protein [Pirellulaceae bacterium]
MTATRNSGPRDRRRRGATIVEYAVILAVIAGAVTVGAGFLSNSAAHTFDSINDAVADAESPTSTSRPPVIVEQRPRLTRSQWLRVWQTPVISLSIVVNLLLWWLLKRRDRLRRLSEQNEETTREYDSDWIFQKRQEIFKTLAAAPERFGRNEVQVCHLMSRGLATVAPNASLAEAAEIMRSAKIRHLLVCDQSGRLVGIISNRDLVKTNRSRVADAMSSAPLTVAPNTPINPAITMFLKQRISCLPVVSDEKLCGVLTTTDILMTMQCALHLLKRQSESEAAANATPAHQHAAT